MDYELCKQLKEAGFPQENKSVQVFQDKKTYELFVQEHAQVARAKEDGTYEVLPYQPSLDELIEACPKKTEESQLTLLWTPGGWIAGYTYHEYWDIESGPYPTPEEAVAMLYIKLHENDKKTKTN